MRNYIDIKGQRFGKWIALEYEGNGKWLCQCDCGYQGLVYSSKLRNGKSKSCKYCARLKYPDPAFNKLFYTYEKEARNRDLDFSLTREEFAMLTKQNCDYCGKDPQQISKLNKYQYLYNGIDRIDSSKGYTLDNCVSCCGRCNRGKGNMTREEFFNLITKIYKNLFEK